LLRTRAANTPTPEGSTVERVALGIFVFAMFMFCGAAFTHAPGRAAETRQMLVLAIVLLAVAAAFLYGAR
jgi:hypothetical protein